MNTTTMAPEGVLPLRVNEMTPSVIICAEGSRISIQWREQRAGQPDGEEYARAEAMAAFLVEAANRHGTAYDAIGSGVKALEWSEAGGATALGLSYDVWLTKDAAQGYREIWLAALMQGGRESIGTFSSKEKAQAACQADFERRVLSCLSTHTAAGAEAVADEGWQPIETAPTGGKFGCFLMLAFGPQGDQTVSEGMHFQGRFYAASVFYTGGPHDTKQFTFREHEVKPTHWRHTLVAPGAARPVEEPGEVVQVVWRAIEDRDQIVETIQTFGEVTLRNSHPVWVRDADGRVYEAVWTVDGRGRGYWWDTEGESPADPVAILPHPLTERAALTGDAQEAGK